MYYDTYAHIDKGMNYNRRMHLLHHYNVTKNNTFEVGKDKIKEVDSCFAGFSLYRMEDMLDPSVRYDYSKDSNNKCEHVFLNKSLGGKVCVNPNMPYYVIRNEGIA